MLYIIDGTGPDGWDDYIRSSTCPASLSDTGSPSAGNSETSTSGRGFCMRLAVEYGGFYRRGPSTDGKETWRLGHDVVAQIMIDRQQKCAPSIVLVGHSRGGAACIYAARKLRELGVAVDGMLLFDAVRRAPPPPKDTSSRLSRKELEYSKVYFAANLKAMLSNQEPIDRIPSGVKLALHMVRDEAFSFFISQSPEWKQLQKKLSVPGSARDGTLDVVAARRFDELRRMHIALRNACRFDCAWSGIPTGFSFGNTGMEAEAGCHLQPISLNRFWATHGAMGGAPLDSYGYIPDRRYADEIAGFERASMKAVWAKANAFLRSLPTGPSCA